MKLALGSASWRSRYGSFSKGPLSAGEIESLIAKAFILGFDFIDTAPSYGDAEETIGNIQINQNLATKVTVDSSDIPAISKSINLSREKLKVDSLDLVFIHNWDNLSPSEKYKSVELMQKCKSIDLIRSWGFSTYEVSEIACLADNGLSDLTVQINSNVLDQRILKINTQLYGTFFSRQKIKIWVRSIFLQGVLLNSSPQNPYFAHPDIRNFFSLCAKLDTSPIEMCLVYISQLEIVDRVVIGIENDLQLNQIWRALQISTPKIDFQSLSSNDLELIDPRRWNFRK